MIDVLKGPEVYTENKPMYLMYREIYSNQDIRFDITVIASRTIGEEYAKTYGHKHPKSPDGKNYPEVYQILYGDAKFILQKENSNGSFEVIIISAKKGDILLIPPGFGHVSINISDSEPLFLSNLVSVLFESDYSEYKQNRGAAAYYTKNGPVQNTNYIIKSITNLSCFELNKKYGFFSKDLLTEFYSNPEKFQFLNKPSLLFR
ncbi:MAG: glucose-6-phosphate isomerase family protein [Candidatus Paceibacterota bacterium]